MNITGIIAEYNPFHNGHLHQIEQVKKNGADYIIVVMSGDFLQRGTPAVLDKWTRARMALSSGADLVIELPAVFATASAQYFARGGVSILDKLGVVDTLSFGCETDDIIQIKETASLLCKEPDIYKDKLQSAIKAGNSFPKARELAVTAILGDTVSSLVSAPNNILALEYCIALLERESDMDILPIKRKGNAYHEATLTENSFPSATAIRNQLAQDCAAAAFDKHLPDSVATILTENKEQLLLSQDVLSLLLKYKLLSCHGSFEHYADITPDLSDKIKKNLNHFESVSQFTDLLKSKDLTHARISRCLTHILLDITQDMYVNAKEKDYAGYARILGFHKRALPLLSEIGKQSSIPLITKLADSRNILGEDAYSALEHDIFCSHVYESIIADKTVQSSQNEFQRQIVICE